MSNNTTNTTDNLFVTATRKKLRFPTNKGEIPVEDLWDLSLTSLDAVAVNLDDQIQKGGRKSFIGRRDTTASVNETKLDIVKVIIEVKQAEAEAAKTRAEKASQKEFLNSLLEKKKIAQLEGLSVDEIEKQLAALEG